MMAIIINQAKNIWNRMWMMNSKEAMRITKIKMKKTMHKNLRKKCHCRN